LPQKEHESLNDLHISSRKIHKSSGKIGISPADLPISSRAIGKSLSEIPISPEEIHKSKGDSCSETRDQCSMTPRFRAFDFL